ncbi:MAG: hypothetical protein BWY82_02344 [Verrucomicrobia bacterium ADurb.Bin474]|nr:MAG: hypothetical protein BWY82_02344 [Verrucomicrobia bacterium ADurb.Bin474]
MVSHGNRALNPFRWAQPQLRFQDSLLARRHVLTLRNRPWVGNTRIILRLRLEVVPDQDQIRIVRQHNLGFPHQALVAIQVIVRPFRTPSGVLGRKPLRIIVGRIDEYVVALRCFRNRRISVHGLVGSIGCTHPAHSSEILALAGRDADHPGQCVGPIQSALGTSQHFDRLDLCHGQVSEIKNVSIPWIVHLNPIDHHHRRNWQPTHRDSRNRTHPSTVAQEYARNMPDGINSHRAHEPAQIIFGQ